MVVAPMRLAVLALYAGAGRAAALVCEQTGANAPEVVTLMASKTNSASEAWVVRPSCAIEIMALATGADLASQRSDIERVDSLPTAIEKLSLPASPLSRGADFSQASDLSSVKISRLSGVKLPNALTKLDISGSAISSLAGIVLPDSITNLDCSSTLLTSLQGVKLPAKLTTFSLEASRLAAVDFTLPSALKTLNLRSTPLMSLNGVNFPALLTSLDLSNTKLTAIEFAMPSQLQTLQISNTAISRIDRINFPAGFSNLWCESSGLTTVRGVKWPRSISLMQLSGNPIVNFEIRQSDLAVVKVMIAQSRFFGDIIQPRCADSTAQRLDFSGKQICVISDDRFEAVYVTGNGVTPDAPASSGTSVGPTEGSGSGVHTSSSTAGSRTIDPSGSLSSEPSTSNGATDPTKPSVRAAGENSTASDIANSSGESKNGATSNLSGDPSIPLRSRKPGIASSSTNTVTSSTSSNTAVVVGVCCGGAVLLTVVVGLSCYASKKRHRSMCEDGNEDKYGSLSTPQVTSSSQAPLPDDLYLSNDVRNDQELIPYRIEQRNLIKGEQIATNKESVVYMAIFQGQDVVVKQLSPGSCEDKRKLSRFMDEIRAGASLEHHKIVAFIGVAWSSVRDLSVVMEFMPLGDLGTLLLNHQNPPTAQDWMRPWSSSNVKGKAAIAQDVAEAVVYLHSFNNPILHRNLKARNVLLDLQGNAKLSGFGISRESSLDDTMTGKIGTAAWIAPESLRGERYDEKVDVYSLGVLLVEMDRCQHPYANDATVRAPAVQQRNITTPLAPRESPGVAYNNTQIAVLVSSGKLRPSVSSECPEQVASLVAKCLSFDPADRPTSMAVYYGLRQARKAIGS